MRALPLHRHYVASALLFHAVEGAHWAGGAGAGAVARVTNGTDGTSKGEDARAFAARVGRRLAFENETLFDPAFFAALGRPGSPRRLAGCARVRVEAKRGPIESEFSLFRYDVTIYKEGVEGGADAGGGDGGAEAAGGGDSETAAVAAAAAARAARAGCALERWDELPRGDGG